MDPVTTDAELLRRYAEDKSEAAFAELVQRHVDLVYSAALRQLGGDAHRARDVVQVVFTTLARKAAALGSHPVLAGWLYTATQHAAAKTVRGEARRRVREQEAHVMNEIISLSGAAIDWGRVRPVLDAAMGELSERDREAVLLRFFARRPFAEIGATLRLSEDGARMRVERALDKLHALLARRGVTSTSAALAVALTGQAVGAAPAGLAASVTGGALAGAAAAGATLVGSATVGAGLLTLMTTGKIAATIAVLGALGVVGFGVHGRKQAREAEASLATASRDQAALQVRLRESETRATQAEGRAREIEQRLAAPSKPGAAPRAGAGAAPGSTEPDDPATVLLKAKLAQSEGDKRALNTARATNPDMQRIMLQSEKAGYALRYGPFYGSLNLSPDQVTRFEQRLAAATESSMDLMAASTAKGVSPMDPAVQKLAMEEKAKFEQDVRQILGEAGFREYQNYDRSQPAREAVSAVLGSLIAIRAPLTADQLNQLTQIVANHSASYQQGGRMKGNVADVRWDNVLKDAQTILSPPQLQVLRAGAAQAQAIQQVREITEAMVRTKVGQPGTPAPLDPTTKVPRG